MEKLTTEKIGNMLLSSTDLHKQTVDALAKITNLNEKIVDFNERTADLLVSFKKQITILYFIVEILVWRVFLWDTTNKLLSDFIYKWTKLPDGYRILILSLVGGIPAAIIANMLSSILIERLKKQFKKDR